MGDYKMSCPVCDSWTNAVGMAVASGEPCPHCGAAAATILEIIAIREQRGDEKLKARAAELLVMNARLTVERDLLARTVQSVTHALEDATEI